MQKNIKDLRQLTDDVPEKEISPEEYRQMVENAEMGLFILQKARFVYSNSSTLKLLKHDKPDHLMGKSILDIVHPEDKDRLKRVFSNFRRLFVSHIPGIRLFTSDNAIVWVKMGFHPACFHRQPAMGGYIFEIPSFIASKNAMVNPSGTRSWGIATDKRIGRKPDKHRTRLEAIFRSVKDAIITVDQQLRVIEANPSVERICGMRAEEIVGKTFPECPNSCSKSCCDILRQTLKKKSFIKEYYIECYPNAKHHQTVSVSSSPLINPEGDFSGAVLVIRDIARLKGLERKMREHHQFHNIVGKSKKMQEIYRLLKELADLETTVLVTGESGTGKDLIAKTLHYHGHRAFNPFVIVNCSALAENLLESELFGHVKGAFTGAIKDKTGRFEAANGGTILLDEVGDISPLIQIKLLRVLQEKEFEKVGDSIPRKVDVRVIACTNKDLKEKVQRGEFREDLYYRLKVMEIAVPPLRERPEDFRLLIEHFCRRFNMKFNKKIEGISGEVLNKFLEYRWPGNIRELEHVMERAFILCRDRVITLKDIPGEIRDNDSAESFRSSEFRKKKPDQAEDILAALQKSRWNKTKAARLLGISRRTLYRKIAQFNIDTNFQ